MAMIRQATAADSTTVGVLLHRFNAEFGVPEPSAAEFARRFETLLAREDVIVLLAGGKEAVGFAFATLRPTPYHDGPLAQLEELYVEPARRSEGIGGRLPLELIELVRDRGSAEMHTGVDAPDTDARRFYERHGFTNTEPDGSGAMLLYLREFG